MESAYVNLDFSESEPVRKIWEEIVYVGADLRKHQQGNKWDTRRVEVSLSRLLLYATALLDNAETTQNITQIYPPGEQKR